MVELKVDSINFFFCRDIRSVLREVVLMSAHCLVMPTAAQSDCNPIGISLRAANRLPRRSIKFADEVDNIAR